MGGAHEPTAREMRSGAGAAVFPRVTRISLWIQNRDRYDDVENPALEDQEIMKKPFVVRLVVFYKSVHASNLHGRARQYTAPASVTTVP